MTAVKIIVFLFMLKKIITEEFIRRNPYMYDKTKYG